MSIALSAVVRPSRLLRAALALHAACLLALALAILRGWAAPVAHPMWVAAACALAAGALGHAAWAARTAHQIDVSGLGELRVTVKHHSGVPLSEPVPMQLLPGSTLWPHLLSLRLRPRQAGCMLVLLVLPDSMPPDQFAALAVACKRIAAGRGARRHQQFVETIK